MLHYTLTADASTLHSEKLDSCAPYIRNLLESWSTHVNTKTRRWEDQGPGPCLSLKHPPPGITAPLALPLPAPVGRWSFYRHRCLVRAQAAQQHRSRLCHGMAKIRNNFRRVVSTLFVSKLLRVSPLFPEVGMMVTVFAGNVVHSPTVFLNCWHYPRKTANISQTILICPEYSIK